MPPRPDLAPIADCSRAEMETLQHEVADAAVFADDFDFDFDCLTSTTGSVEPHTPDAQSTFDTVHEPGPGPEAKADSESKSASRDAPLDHAPIVAGVDQAFLDDRAVSAIVAMRAGEVIERTHAVTELDIPYIPGLLSFREGQPILDAVETLSVDPDWYLFDGSGRIHYRQAGIATHIGVVLDAPSVGVAKSLLCGRPRNREATDDLQVGDRVPIEANSRVDAPDGTLIGYALQTKQYESSRRHVNPVYVSPGHRVGPDTACELVLATTSSYKLPDPIRLADTYADEVKRDFDR